MAKSLHEIRDPIHVFIKMDSHERKVVDSRPFQRLRHIHQLALTNLVYPGATHRRFEHSLGVMELAGRVFDKITDPHNVTDEVRGLLPNLNDDDERRYWRKVVRMAALCHDIGHLPFSHAAEKELLPDGVDHEEITKSLILSGVMTEIFDGMNPPVRPSDVAKLAVGQKHYPDEKFTDWETILSEIIVGDVFGVDRMDYLLRDSYHAGVAYGRFDHYRLIDTLKILTKPDDNLGNEGSVEPYLGVEEGGLQSAEALLLARYFMFSQVYLHPVRRIYDIHLKDFLKSYLPGGNFDIDIEKHLKMTDNEVLTAIYSASRNSSAEGHSHAKTIVERAHYKLVYQKNPNDQAQNPEAALAVFRSLGKIFGQENVRVDTYSKAGGNFDFPVLNNDRRVVSSLTVSTTLNGVPPLGSDYVFIRSDLREDAQRWLDINLTAALKIEEEE